MKILRLVLIAGLFFIIPMMPVSGQESSTETAIIQVDGLSCPFCAYGLEKHLKKLNGVESVEINMKSGKATVNLKPGSQLDDAVLKEAVKKAGFTARSITHQ